MLNAVAHKDYSSKVPTQISVYAHKIIFWNESSLIEKGTQNNAFPAKDVGEMSEKVLELIRTNLPSQQQFPRQ